ncbi:MurR/RpiR family transcriptional regulator [Clostridium intestinale]|uniref:MurR/RpiR family transcriptional regulator n=1 Tax=Clostridium intestinale TaxID=36845 RepID=UPI002DD62C38|nr:MurR/RpiR family transcriptional regulator [Clostridium intestinale]WRY51555.1 MurR/RpiR family transcriptional regulator [Clostridium intestinale]
MNEVIYRLLFLVNSNKEKDIYYTIAWTMLNNIKKVPKLNINQLADMCYTSSATISRFIKKLEYESFSEFKEQVDLNLKYYRLKASFNPKFIQEKSSNPDELTNDFYDLVINNLKQTSENLDIRKLDKLVEYIYRYKKIAFFGMQFSQYISMEIQTMLLMLGKLVTAFVDMQEQYQYVDDMDENSLAIILTVAGRVANTELIKKIKNKNAKLVIITQNPNTQYMEEADLVLLYGNPDVKSIESLVGGRYALLSVIDMIYYRYESLYNHTK